MIDYVALVLSVIALAFAAVLMYRDAKRWSKSEPKSGPNVFSKIEALVKKRQYETEPGHRTTVAYVKDIMAKAEHDAAKIRFIK